MPKDQILEFPCDIPIKVIGQKVDNFKSDVLAIIYAFCNESEVSILSENSSRSSKYISLTINVKATDRKHIDNIYIALSASKKIKMVL